jgi:acyl carrier protein
MQDENVSAVIAMLNRVLKAPAGDLSPGTKILEIDGFDSLAMEQLVGELQNVIGDDIDPLAFAQVETIADVARILDSKPRSAG